MFRDCLYLVSKGVPWDVVFGARKRPFTATQRLAAAVVFGEMDGGLWDWSALRWQER